MHIRLSREPGPEPYETGGGIKFAKPLITDTEPFIAHNADILSNMNPLFFVKQATKNKTALASLLVMPPRPEDDRFFLFRPEDMRLAGWTNARTGEIRGAVRGVPGAPPDSPASEECRRMSFCGIHLISQEIFALLENWPERFSITDFYIREAGRHPIYGIPAPEGFRIIDIGSPGALAEAEKALRHQGSR